MEIDLDIIKMTEHYIGFVEKTSHYLNSVDIICALEYTREIGIEQYKLLCACNNDLILFEYYKEITISINTEDYIKAQKYKELIEKYETTI